jgi:hypothetical protein
MKFDQFKNDTKIYKKKIGVFNHEVMDLEETVDFKLLHPYEKELNEL